MTNVRLPKLLSVREAADHLRLCTKTVYGLIKSGALRSSKVGAGIRITEADLAGYIASMRS